MVDQRADLVDKARAILLLVYFAFGGSGKKWRINKDTVEGFACRA